jgi:hypothetical protein
LNCEKVHVKSHFRFFCAFALAGATLMCGCPPSPVAPTWDGALDSSSPSTLDASASDAAPALDVWRTPEDQACVTLMHIGCTVLNDCAATIRKINGRPTNFNPIDVACLEAAKTRSDVSKCGVICGDGGG